MTIFCKIIPGARVNKIVKEDDAHFKVYLMARPEKGRANKALIKILAKDFGVAKSKVVILRGEKAREKEIFIEDKE